jgi:hypothetical protein
MNISTTPQNQTPPNSLTILSEKGLLLTGTGLFLVPAPEKGILEYKVILVPNLNYHESVKRGSTCHAFKWIPDSLMTWEELSKKRDTMECRDHLCFPRTDEDCPPFCMCVWGQSICQ